MLRGGHQGPPTFPQHSSWGSHPGHRGNQRAGLEVRRQAGSCSSPVCARPPDWSWSEAATTCQTTTLPCSKPSVCPSPSKSRPTPSQPTRPACPAVLRAHPPPLASPSLHPRHTGLLAASQAPSCLQVLLQQLCPRTPIPPIHFAPSLPPPRGPLGPELPPALLSSPAGWSMFTLQENIFFSVLFSQC